MLVLIVAYLLGSIPFGYLLVRAKEGGDIRQTGSGGTGATNVSRRAGKLAGVATLILDAAKGATAVYLARELLTPAYGINWWVAAAAILAIVGHVFPIWLAFRGGKGVATGVGVFVVLSPFAVAVVAVVFLLVVLTTRYVSLGSIFAVVAFPLCVWMISVYVKPIPELEKILATAAIGGALIVFMHRENIRRLVAGTESRFR